MKCKRLVPLALIPLLVCIAAAQEKIVSRTPNVAKIARLWNSLIPATKDYNEHMNAAQKLLQDRLNPKIVVVDPDAKRSATVGHLKAAREALLKEVDALNELIEEEDY